MKYLSSMLEAILGKAQGEKYITKPNERLNNME